MKRKARTRAAIGRRRLHPATLRAWRARLREGDEVAVSGYGRGRVIGPWVLDWWLYVAVPRPGHVSRDDWEYPAVVKRHWCQPVRSTPRREVKP